jgi:hypothetical protein
MGNDPKDESGARDGFHSGLAVRESQRDLAQASLDRVAVQANARAMITPDRLAAFSQLMREKLDTGDTQARKAFLRSVISQVEATAPYCGLSAHCLLASVVGEDETGHSLASGLHRRIAPAYWCLPSSAREPIGIFGAALSGSMRGS